MSTPAERDISAANLLLAAPLSVCRMRGTITP